MNFEKATSVIASVVAYLIVMALLASITATVYSVGSILTGMAVCAGLSWVLTTIRQSR